MKRVAVILSGCGVQDGSEIQEAVLTLLYLDQQGANVQCFAPDITQAHVINHTSGQTMDESRDVLVESARICRGEIKGMHEANADDFDAAILPGGYGAAKNLCNYAFDQEAIAVEPGLMKFIQAMAKASKPVAFLCISPVMIHKLYPQGVKATLGDDDKMATWMTQKGHAHTPATPRECVIDTDHKVITTPAYISAQSISEAGEGIEKAVKALIDLA